MIDDAFGAERIYFTSVHAYTNDDLQMYQQLICAARSQSEHHSNRNGLQNSEKLFPKLENKISGLVLKFQCPTVHCRYDSTEKVSVTAINEVIRTEHPLDILVWFLFGRSDCFERR